jgi:hypothetical protein
MYLLVVQGQARARPASENGTLTRKIHRHERSVLARHCNAS